MSCFRPDRPQRPPARRPIGLDIGVRDGRIAARRARPAGWAARRSSRRAPRLAALRRRAFSHGYDAQPRHAAPQRVRHPARRHRAVGRGQAVADAEIIAERALAYCDWAVGRGLLAIRSHVDIGDPRLLAVDALLEVKRKVAPYLDLQLVAFPQDGYLRSPKRGRACSSAALDRRRRGRGRHPAFRAHHGRWRGVGAPAVRARRASAGCGSTCIATKSTIRCRASRNAGGRDGAARHAGAGDRFAPHLDAFDGQLLRQQADPADGARPASHAIANPLINITLQGRHDTYPKRRGMTRVPELMAAGLDRRLRPRLRDGPVLSAGLGRHARGRLHGPACGADDRHARRCAPASMR